MMCEECAYCSIDGYCIRKEMPIDIEAPVCGMYERHPLLVQLEAAKVLAEWMYLRILQGDGTWGYARGCEEAMLASGVWKPGDFPIDEVAVNESLRNYGLGGE